MGNLVRGFALGCVRMRGWVSGMSMTLMLIASRESLSEDENIDGFLLGWF